jgi:hypothetical protein
VRTANQLRDMAAQCGGFATLAKTEEVREQLLEVADQFERVAKGLSVRTVRPVT